MPIRQMRVGTLQNFVYLLVDEPSGEAMVIDSGWETDSIVSVAREEGQLISEVGDWQGRPSVVWGERRMVNTIP